MPVRKFRDVSEMEDRLSTQAAAGRAESNMATEPRFLKLFAAARRAATASESTRSTESRFSSKANLPHCSAFGESPEKALDEVLKAKAA